MEKSKNSELLQTFLWTGGALILGLIVSFAFLPAVGEDPFAALQLMVGMTFSDSFNMGKILVKAAPLILCSLAFASTFKANLFNIGAQGQFYMGCICATAISLGCQDVLPPFLTILLAALGAMAGGAAIGYIIALLKTKFNANEFLVSMMSTYVVLYIMKLLLRTSLQESKHEYVQSDMLSNAVWLPKFLPGTTASIGILISVVAAIAIYFILKKTTLGYRIQVTGLNMDAARLSGIDPKKQFLIAFAISGCLAGLAGFIEVNGMQHMLLDGLDSDIGSYGIGIAIMANSNPIGVIFCSLLFGALQAGGTILSHETTAPASIIDLMLGIVMLFVLFSFFFRNRHEIKKTIKKQIALEGKK